MVRLAGIEPTTPWFVAKYSIQLSYSRPSTHYSGRLEKWEGLHNPWADAVADVTTSLDEVRMVDVVANLDGTQEPRAVSILL